MKINELLLGLLAGALETAGESKLIEVLQDLHDKNPDQYKAAIYGGNALVKALLPVVTKSKTKIDDIFILSLNDAIQTSATNNGIDLESEEAKAALSA